MAPLASSCGRWASSRGRSVKAPERGAARRGVKGSEGLAFLVRGEAESRSGGAGVGEHLRRTKKRRPGGEPGRRQHSRGDLVVLGVH
jgi:hypothetical protein